MEQPNLSALFQATDPNYGKSETDILLERVRNAQAQNLSSQMSKAQELEAKAANTKGKEFNKAGAIASALGSVVSPNTNMFAQYMQLEKARPDERMNLMNEADQARMSAMKSADALGSDIYKSGGVGRQKEMADYQHKLAMQRIGANQANQMGKANAPKKLKPTEIERVNEGNEIPQMLDDTVLTLQENKELFDPITGTARGFDPYDVQAKTVDADLRAKSQSFGRFMEGGVLRKEDEEKYRKMFPQIGDTPAVAENKLQIVRRQLIQKQNSLLDAYRSQGYDLTGLDKGLVVPDRVGQRQPMPPSAIEPGKVTAEGQPNYDSYSDEELEKAYKMKMGIK